MLTWNVWVNHPERVDQDEWRDHAEKWRKSIDTSPISPDRQQTPARFRDGTVFHPVEDLVNKEISKIYDYIWKHRRRDNVSFAHRNPWQGRFICCRSRSAGEGSATAER